MGNSVGYWRSCTGCTESEDGHLVGYYPMHPKHGVPVGSGCDECKGKGVVFNPWTKAMQDDFEKMAMGETH